jgi:hypothetical protein
MLMLAIRPAYGQSANREAHIRKYAKPNNLSGLNEELTYKSLNILVPILLLLFNGIEVKKKFLIYLTTKN